MIIGAVVVLLLAVPAPSAKQDCRADSAAVREIRSVADGIIAADNQRAIDRVLGFYSADAILMPPNEGPVQGRPAIKPRYETLFEQFDPAIEGHVDEACVSGSTGFVRGRNTGAMKGRAGQRERTLNDVYLMLLRREPDGMWRITHLMWHPGDRQR